MSGWMSAQMSACRTCPFAGRRSVDGENFGPRNSALWGSALGRETESNTRWRFPAGLRGALAKRVRGAVHPKLARQVRYSVPTYKEEEL